MDAHRRIKLPPGCYSVHSVVTKILVGPDPGLLNTRATHALATWVWLMRSRGRMGWPCALTQRTFTSPGPWPLNFKILTLLSAGGR